MFHKILIFLQINVLSLLKWDIILHLFFCTILCEMRFRKKYLRWKVDYTIDVKITDNGLGILLRDVWKYSSQAQWHNKGKVKSDIKYEYTLVSKKNEFR